MSITRSGGRRFRTVVLGCLVAAALLAAGPARAQTKKARLTFDDGPGAGTADVLKVLKELKAPATFFLTGSNKGTLKGGEKEQKDLVERMLKEGHTVGNHTYVHDPMTKAQYVAKYGDLKKDEQKQAFRKNLTDNLDHFRKLLNDPKFSFAEARLPGDGREFPVYVDEVKAMGMTHVTWHFEFAPNGAMKGVPEQNWKGIAGVAATYARIPNDNDIILFHDAHWAGDKKALLKAALTKLKDNEFTFVK